MVHTIDLSPGSNDGAAALRIWVAIALSLLMHIAAMWGLPQKIVPQPGSDEAAGIPAPLTLRLIPQAPPRPSPLPLPLPPANTALPPATPEAAPARRPKPAPHPQRPPTPPAIALKPSPPDTPQAVPVTPPAPESKPAANDLSAYIEAQRRARGAPAQPPPVEDDDARRNRIIAGNLGSARDRTFGYDPSRSGGVFQIERLDYDYAEFIFFGWNKDISRNTKQLIEVRKGNNSDIRIAVVRKMVAIIREYEQEDFLWVSRRLGRSLTLSARPRDRAGLEDFMMREFFHTDIRN